MRYLLLLLLTAWVSVSGAFAQSTSQSPTLRLINFTADWCPNCQALNPKIEEAIETLTFATVERVDLDMTGAHRSASEEEKAVAWNNAVRLADSKQAGYLWDWYGGVTGIAVIISADNGEPISCLNRTHSTNDIIARFREAEVISLRRTPGSRMPNGPECPPPFR